MLNSALLCEKALKVHALLRQKGHRVSAAESLTGGLVAWSLSSQPGATSVFSGGVVTYTNEAKANLLGVERTTLDELGAVSFRCAEEMAQNVARMFGTEWGLATTGYAGSNSANQGGLVFVHVSGPGGISHGRKCEFEGGDRIVNQNRSAEAVLQLALDILEGRAAQ